MFKTIDEITANYEVDGITIIEELDKVFLNRGRWTTILFWCQVRTPATGEYKPKAILRRYQKRKGEFKVHGSIGITPKMVPALIEALTKYFN